VHLAGHREADDLGAYGLGDRLADGAAGRAPPVAGVGLGPPGGRHQYRVLGPAAAEDSAVAGSVVAGPVVVDPFDEADHEDLDAAGPEVDPENRTPPSHNPILYCTASSVRRAST